MSDEESFVILGSCSPKNSLEINGSLRQGFQSLEISKIEKDSIDAKTPDASLGNKDEKDDAAQNNIANQPSNATPTNSINDKLLEAQQEEVVYDNSKNVTNNSLERSVENNQSVPIENSTPMNRSAESATSGSLAVSFIMGEKNAEELKASVYSQFPSICSMEACAEDVVKLQNFMSEYIELKCTLSKVNATMRIFYDKTQKWRDDMLQYKTQLENCQTEIATLRNENLELKREMRTNMEQIKITDDFKKKEVTEMVQLISEKAALVDNLRAQIEHLETQNLATFEYVSRNGQDGKQSSDYIARSEHLLEIKEKDRKMSELLAESLDLKDMQKIYVDEINCLKVNLTSAEELLQQSLRDIELLKASDLEKSKRFTEYETERDKMREEILVLRQQVDVYGKDFHIERSARETLAGEKDQLLQDLRSIQRANQELIENQNRVLNNAIQANASTNTTNTGYRNDANNGGSRTTANQVSSRFIAAPPSAAAFASNLQQRPIRPLPQPSPSNTVSRFNCPVCGEGFQSLSILQSHVHACLDNS